ncbi:hypothetical protein [Flavobacterium sp.]|uniref:hypothetical protein n=1 Tax=Flavobacterium sp. TaxID=239 RepID=UPI0025C3955B|nr:hypothetical protein [Flavobacterium sp.]
MKKIILLLFFSLLPFCSKSSNLDTIPTWKVYYNDSLLKFISDNENNSIEIKSSKYKPGDYLAIQYFDDMPCTTCQYSLIVIGEGKLEVTRVESKGKNKLNTIDLKELINFHSKHNQSTFIIYLYGLNDKNKNNGKRLVTLTID